MAHAPDRIRVNAVSPGLIATPGYTEMIASQDDPAEAEARFLAYAPSGRTAGPEAISYGCIYLASDESTHVTGTDLVIDGGMIAW